MLQEHNTGEYRFFFFYSNFSIFLVVLILILFPQYVCLSVTITKVIIYTILSKEMEKESNKQIEKKIYYASNFFKVDKNDDKGVLLYLIFN